MGIMKLICPYCMKEGNFDDGYRGKVVECSHCLKDFREGELPHSHVSTTITGTPLDVLRQQPNGTCKLAVIAMFVSFLGFIPFVASIGFVLGIIAIYQIHASNRKLKGMWMAIIPLILIIPMTPISIGIFIPFISQYREKMNQTTCISNQRQLAVAIQMYAQDHDNSLPSDKTVWTDIYVNPDILICSSAGKRVLNTYGYNSKISEKKVKSIANIATTYLTIDSSESINTIHSMQDIDFRHDGSAIASFIDGHAANIFFTGEDTYQELK